MATKVVAAKKKVAVKTVGAAKKATPAKTVKAVAKKLVVAKAKSLKPEKSVKAPDAAKPAKAVKPEPKLRPKVRAAKVQGDTDLVDAKDVGSSVLSKKRLNPNNLVPDALPPIDKSVDPSKRRLGGFDIERFRARHRLKILDVVYALALHPYPHLQKTMKMETLPYPTELLIRLYDLKPGPAPWKTNRPKELFDMFYGEELAKFKSTEWAQSAQLAMYRRFAALFSRDVATTYRWMAGGQVRVDIQMIMSKLTDVPNPRELLEDLARLTWKHRGLNFDENFPMPTLENPPTLKARGRKPKPMTLAK